MDFIASRALAMQMIVRAFLAKKRLRALRDEHRARR